MTSPADIKAGQNSAVAINVANDTKATPELARKAEEEAAAQAEAQRKAEAEAAAAAQAQEQTVYITNSGSKYHRSGYRYLKKSKIPISLSDAQARGYTACSVCF